MTYNARNRSNDTIESQKEKILVLMLIFSKVSKKSQDVIIKKISYVEVWE